MNTIRELLAARPDLRAAVDVMVRAGVHADVILASFAVLPGMTEQPAAITMFAPRSPHPVAPPPSSVSSWDTVVAELNAELQRNHPVTAKSPLRPAANSRAA